MKKVETAIVEFFAGEGAKRVVYQDEFGFCIKHRGSIENVEKSDGKWIHTPTKPDAYYRRNPHIYGDLIEDQKPEPEEETISLYSVVDLAGMLKISKQALHKAVEKGRIAKPKYKISDRLGWTQEQVDRITKHFVKEG